MSATSKIHYCIGSLNVGVVPRVQHFSAFHFSKLLKLKLTHYILLTYFPVVEAEIFYAMHSPLSTFK